jgi:MraZ protein
MFLGTFEHTLDEKGRLAMPARFRALLSDGLVITSSLEQCLLVYPKAGFEALFEKLSALPVVDAQAGILRRMLFSNANDITPDKQFRVVVPQPLREYAGISEHAIIVGVGKWAEVWSPAAWRVQQEAILKQAQDTEALRRLGV